MDETALGNGPAYDHAADKADENVDVDSGSEDTRGNDQSDSIEDSAVVEAVETDTTAQVEELVEEVADVAVEAAVDEDDGIKAPDEADNQGDLEREPAGEQIPALPPAEEIMDESPSETLDTIDGKPVDEDDVDDEVPEEASATTADVSLDFEDDYVETDIEMDYSDDDIAEHTPLECYKAACKQAKATPCAFYVDQCQRLHVNLSHSGLTLLDSKCISAGLEVSDSLENLDLSDNRLSCNALAPMLEALCSLSSLKTLNLSQNRIDQGNIDHIVSFMETSNITELDLSFNHLKGVESAQIAAALPAAPALAALNLRGNAVGNDFCDALAEACPSLHKLTKLDLSWNKIRLEGAGVLCQALGSCPCLVELNLGWNGLGDDGAGSLANALEESSTIELIDLTSNRIGDIGAVALSTGLAAAPKLRKVKLALNPIEEEGMLALCDAFASNPVIAEADLQNVPLNGDMPQKLAAFTKAPRALVQGRIFIEQCNAATSLLQRQLTLLNHAREALDHLQQRRSKEANSFVIDGCSRAVAAVLAAMVGGEVQQQHQETVQLREKLQAEHALGGAAAISCRRALAKAVASGCSMEEAKAAAEQAFRDADGDHDHMEAALATAANGLASSMAVEMACTLALCGSTSAEGDKMLSHLAQRFQHNIDAAALIEQVDETCRKMAGKIGTCTAVIEAKQAFVEKRKNSPKDRAGASASLVAVLDPLRLPKATKQAMANEIEAVTVASLAEAAANKVLSKNAKDPSGARDAAAKELYSHIPKPAKPEVDLDFSFKITQASLRWRILADDKMASLEQALHKAMEEQEAAKKTVAEEVDRARTEEKRRPDMVLLFDRGLDHPLLPPWERLHDLLERHDLSVATLCRRFDTDDSGFISGDDLTVMLKDIGFNADEAEITSMLADVGDSISYKTLNVSKLADRERQLERTTQAEGGQLQASLQQHVLTAVGRVLSETT